MECPQCRSEVSDDATQCETCGKAWEATIEERPAPAGTWSERTLPPGSVIRPEDAVQKPMDRIEGSAPLRFRRPTGTNADMTPLPGLALALAAPHPPEDEGSPRPKTGTHRAMGEVVPLRPSPASVPAAKTESTERTDLPASVPRRPPPLLASKLLAEDLTPKEPYRRTSRALYCTAGFGSILVLPFGNGSFATFVVSMFLVAIGVVGAATLPYRTRALASLALGLGGLVTSITTPGGPGLLTGLATGAVTVLSGGLFLRGTHRTALSARLLVLGGIVASAGWLALSSYAHPLHTVGFEWQSWIPATLKVFFFLVGLLSLLAFMDSSTHAGCALWGGLALMWLTAHIGCEMAIAWVDGTSSPLGNALTIAHPLLAATTGMALTQTLADLAHRNTQRTESAPSS